MTWRPSAIIRHGLVSTIADASRTLATVAVVAVLTGAICYSDVVVVGSTRQEEHDRIEAGLNVIIARSATGIDGQRCEALERSEGILASGGFTPGPLAVLSSDKRTRVPTGEASPGMIRLWSQQSDIYQAYPDIENGNIVIGRALSNQLALNANAHLTIENQEAMTIAAILPELERTLFVSGWILKPALPTGLVTECWIESDNQTRGSIEPIARATFNNPSLEVQNLAAIDARSRDLSHELQQRPARMLLAVAFVAFAAFGSLMAYVRRSEFGLYRALGMGRTGVLVVIQIETLVATVIGTTLGIIWSIAILTLTAQLHQPGDLLDLLPIALRDAAGGAAAMMITLPLTAAAVARGNILSALKDR